MKNIIKEEKNMNINSLETITIGFSYLDFKKLCEEDYYGIRTTFNVWKIYSEKTGRSVAKFNDEKNELIFRSNQDELIKWLAYNSFLSSTQSEELISNNEDESLNEAEEDNVNDYTKYINFYNAVLNNDHIKFRELINELDKSEQDTKLLQKLANSANKLQTLKHHLNSQAIESIVKELVSNNSTSNETEKETLNEDIAYGGYAVEDNKEPEAFTITKEILEGIDEDYKVINFQYYEGQGLYHFTIEHTLEDSEMHNLEMGRMRLIQLMNEYRQQAILELSRALPLVVVRLDGYRISKKAKSIQFNICTLYSETNVQDLNKGYYSNPENL